MAFALYFTVRVHPSLSVTAVPLTATASLPVLCQPGDSSRRLFSLPPALCTTSSAHAAPRHARLLPDPGADKASHLPSLRLPPLMSPDYPPRLDPPPLHDVVRRRPYVFNQRAHERSNRSRVLSPCRSTAAPPGVSAGSSDAGAPPGVPPAEESTVSPPSVSVAESSAPGNVEGCADVAGLLVMRILLRKSLMTASSYPRDTHWSSLRDGWVTDRWARPLAAPLRRP